MSLFQSFKRSPVVHFWMLIVFLISGLIINCVQIIILFIWPFNKSLYRRLVSKISYLYLAELTFAGEWWADIDITFYGKKEDYEQIGNESAMLMPNHRSDIDWLVGYIIAERKGILGTAKCFMKNDLKYIPTIGWTWWFLEFSFLRRNWQKDENTIKNSLKALNEYPIPYLIGIFAEGTRMTPAKLKASQEFAVSKGIQPLKHHLLPRPKGFAFTVHALKNSVPAIYDIEVAFANPEKANLKTLINGGKIKTHLYLRRIEMKDVPTESIEATSQWCKDLYKEKDAIFDDYTKNGAFSADVVNFPKRYSNLIIVLAWQIFLFIPMMFFVKYIISSFSYAMFGGIALSLLLGFIVVKLLFYYADTKRSSSFGLSASKGRQQNMNKKQEDSTQLNEDSQEQNGVNAELKKNE
eukprot:gene17320-8898_t